MRGGRVDTRFQRFKALARSSALQGKPGQNRVNQRASTKNPREVAIFWKKPASMLLTKAPTVSR